MFKIVKLAALSIFTLTTFSLAGFITVSASANELTFNQQTVENKTTRSACLKKKDHIWDSATKRCIHVPRGSY